MFDALRDAIETAATSAVSAGGAAIAAASFRRSLYDELPALPAACLGPARTLTVQHTHSGTAAGSLDTTSEVGVLLALSHAAGPDAADTFVERFAAALGRQGLTVAEVALTEDEWGGVACFTASFAVRANTRLTYT